MNIHLRIHYFNLILMYTMHETCCVVYGTVHSIQYKNGWAYIGCKECNTKVTPIAPKSGMNSRNKKQLWFCKNHGDKYDVACRYVTHLHIISY